MDIFSLCYSSVCIFSFIRPCFCWSSKIFLNAVYIVFRITALVFLKCKIIAIVLEVFKIFNLTICVVTWCVYYTKGNVVLVVVFGWRYIVL